MKLRYIFAALVMLCSCCQKDSLKSLNLKELTKPMVSYMEERYDKYFEHYGAIFLENTDSCLIKDVKQIFLIESSIYMLANNRINCHCLSTGRVNIDFHFSNESKKITAFDWDTVKQKFYAIEALSSRLICFDASGFILFELPLDSRYKYDQVMVLDEEHLLLTAQSLPVPVTFIADLNSNQITPLDKPNKKSFTPDSIQSQQLESLGVPLFVWSKSEEGVWCKYLFDDIIYQYTKEGKNPVYRVHSGKDGIAYKNKSDLFKKNKQLALSNFWQLSDNQWLLTWNPRKQYQLCDSLMRPYCHTPPCNQATLIVWIKDGSVFSIGIRTKKLFDESARTLFSLQRYQPIDGEDFDKNMINAKLPDNLKEYPQKREILLCYYVFNNISE